MPAKRHKRHSEGRWAQLPEHLIRCQAHNPNGRRCGFEAEAGSVVCERHGGGAPQVRRRAAERLIMTADEAVELLIKWMRDPEVPHGVRAKIAQDIADRAGLAATQVHQIIPTNEDPVTRLFENLLSDSANLEHLAPDGNYYTQDQLMAKAFPDSAKAIESGQSDGKLTAEEYQRLYGDDVAGESEVIFDAEVVEDQQPAPAATVNGDDTPARIRQMIQDHVFDSQPAARS